MGRHLILYMRTTHPLTIAESIAIDLAAAILGVHAARLRGISKKNTRSRPDWYWRPYGTPAPIIHRLGGD